MLLSDYMDNDDFVEAIDNLTDEHWEGQTTSTKVDDTEVTITCIETYGGEGQGEDYWAVVSIEQEGDTIYVRRNGWYASYHGREWNDYEQVKPVEKTVVFWESM